MNDLADKLAVEASHVILDWYGIFNFINCLYYHRL
jgi:hypothetical protein